MSFAHILWVALLTSIVVGGCEPDEKEKKKEEPLECSDGQVARDYCCEDPSSLGDDPSCDMMCFQGCESDDDCDTNLNETCQDGACAEMPGDCYI
jgi:hypothetical protein